MQRNTALERDGDVRRHDLRIRVRLGIPRVRRGVHWQHISACVWQLTTGSGGHEPNVSFGLTDVEVGSSVVTGEDAVDQCGLVLVAGWSHTGSERPTSRTERMPQATNPHSTSCSWRNTRRSRR